jgi:hypothetical protein
MQSNLIKALVAAVVLAPVPAFASADDNRDNQVVCRRDREANLGSHLRAPRTCRTRAEWRELEDHSQRELQQIRDGQQAQEPNEGASTGGTPS